MNHQPQTPSSPPARLVSYSPPLDPQGFIAAHAPCINCNYNLRGLKPNGICPECGSPVALSTTGPLLRCSQLSSLLRLRTGLELVRGGYFCLLLAPLADVSLTVASSRNPGALTAVGLLAASTLQAIGIFNLTTHQQPGRRRSAAATTFRTMISAVSMIPLAFLMLAGSLNSSLAHSDFVCFAASGLSGFLFGIAGAIYYRYVAKLTDGYGRRELSRIGTSLAISFALCGLLIAFGSFAEATRSRPGGLNWQVVPWLAGWLLGAIDIIGALVFISLVLRFVSAELKIAQAWAAPTDLAP